MYVAGYLGFIIFACNLMLARMQVKEVSADALPTVDYVATVYADATNTALALVTPSPTFTASPTVTQTPIYTVISPVVDPLIAVSPVASIVAGPTSYNTNIYSKEVYALSFYDPHIGAIFPDMAHINCLEFDFSINDCVSKVNHGQDDYHEWIGKGAACTTMLAYDTVFYVHTPLELSGIWRCIDTGALDVNGLHYIDFMLTYPDMIWTGNNLNDFPWSSEVIIEVLSVP